MALAGEMYSLACHSACSMIVDGNRSSIWVMGENGHAWLGVGKFDKILYPVINENVPDNIVSVAAGGSHSLILDSEGQVWGVGWNDYGQLGMEREKVETSTWSGFASNVWTFTKLTLLPPITAIHARANHSLYLDSEGSVWSSGWNSNGQLGLGERDPPGSRSHHFIPTKLQNLPPIKGICAGDNSSMFLDTNGCVWATGQFHSYYDFGFSGTTLYKPEKVQTINVPVKFITHRAHCCFIDEEDNVWSFGINSQGQLGLGTKVHVVRPKMIPDLPPIAAVAVGSEFTLLLDVNGTLYFSGKDYSAGLSESEARSVSHPRVLHKRIKFSALCSNSSHALVTDVDGNVWGWGRYYTYVPLGDITNYKYKAGKRRTFIKIPEVNVSRQNVKSARNT